MQCIKVKANLNVMISFHFFSLTSVNYIVIPNIIYLNRSLFSHLVFIFYINVYLPWAFLLSNIALFKDRSDGKYLCKLSHWLIWIKVGWIVQVKFFDSAANAALYYPREKLPCADARELILIELKYLNTWLLFTDDFWQHFNCSQSVIKSLIFKPWWIVTEIKILDGKYGGV